MDEAKGTKSKTISNKNLCTIVELAIHNREKGIWPSSESVIRRLRAKKDKFKESFIKVGYLVLVDRDKFWKEVEQYLEEEAE